MKKSDPVQKAVVDFNTGYQCSQSIFRAFASRFGIQPDITDRIAAPFGAGMSRKGWMCGAVTGGMMIIGLKYGHTDPQGEEIKEEMYIKVRSFIDRFQELHESVMCRDLIGCDISSPEGLEKARSEALFDDLCPEFVRSAAELVQKIIEKID